MTITVPRRRARAASLREMIEKYYLITVVLLFLAFAPSGCRREANLNDYPVLYDFVENFPLADVQREIALIDFGTPTARMHMREGWWGDEGSGDATFVWGFGEKSVLDFFLSQVREVRLRFRCTPFRFPWAPAQTISIAVNGKQVSQVSLVINSSEYQVVLKEEVIKPGMNRLEFGYAYSQVPKNVVPGAGDVRPLAVAWDYIRFGNDQEQLYSPPRAAPENGKLYIPFGSQLDYYLNLPRDSILTLEGVTTEASAGARLRVILQLEGEEEEVIGDFPLSVEFEALSLPVKLAHLLRISFRAVSSKQPSAGPGGLTVTRPVIRTKDPLKIALVGRRRPNIIIYLIDALRRDHLGCYGYDKPVTPNIDSFAREATLFENAVAQGFWTKPTVTSIFTGLCPRAHGVNGINDVLAAEATTLAETLRAAGYYTAAFSTNAVATNVFQLDHGFVDFLDLSRRHDQIIYHQLSNEVNESIFSWLEKQKHSEPFFLYIHTLDPHSPYSPPREFQQRFAGKVADPKAGYPSRLKLLKEKKIPVTESLIEDLVSLYDAEVAFNDHHFGAFLKVLRQRKLYEDSLIFLVADHGEEFYEHGSWEHGNLYGEVLNIPFIVKFPSDSGIEERKVPYLAQQIDLLPTILDYLGLEIPEHVEGRSLLALLSSGEENKRPHRAFSGSWHKRRQEASVIEGPWKLIRKGNPRANDLRLELYNREQDPREKNNVYRQQPAMATHLLSLLEEHERSHKQGLEPSRANIDEELRKKLKALGYVE